MVCYLFYLIAAPFATNLSGGVRTTGVMVNASMLDYFLITVVFFFKA